MATIEEQVEVLMSGTAYGDPDIRKNMAKDLRERLRECEIEGRPLRVYCGYDPRTSDLHLGHTITMRKLRQFQDFGHDVTFLVGTFTSLIGDPSDKDSARDQLTMKNVEDNAQTYAEQAFKILDSDKTRVRRNDEWLSTLDFADIIRLASHFTVQQFLVRENFAKRIDEGKAIFLHEFFYALMQAYDAVAQEADVQVGGQDQLFNILVAGRKLQKGLGQKEQIAIIMGEMPAWNRRRYQNVQEPGQSHPFAVRTLGYVWQGHELARQCDGRLSQADIGMDTNTGRFFGRAIGFGRVAS